LAQIERLYYNYTPAAIEDELIFLLSSKNEYDLIPDEKNNGCWYIHIFHPYLNQAEGLLYKINSSDPLPEFVIWDSDVPDGLANELTRLGKVKMKRVITNAVRRIYESVNQEYYHTNGIHGKIKWRFGEG
jgi:hypothetical protein